MTRTSGAVTDTHTRLDVRPRSSEGNGGRGLFDAEEDQTRVTLQHRGFEVHGEAGPGMRESVGSDGDWRSLLQRHRAAP